MFAPGREVIDLPRGEDAAKQKTLMRGVLVLLPAALFTKLIGLFYKIPLLHIVGVEGMAYFLAAYHVYSLLFVLSATGLPTALSLQISRALATGGTKHVRRLLLVAMALFLGVGIPGSICLWAFAPQLAERLAMREASAAIMAIAPALALAAFIGAGKGFFQGHHRMGATALCEVLEAGGKLGFGLWFALLAKERGLPTPQVAAYAIFGITAGMALSALVLLACLIWHCLRHPAAQAQAVPRGKTLLLRLLREGLPMTVSASVMSLVSLLDTALISARLQAGGFAAEVANAMYSSYGNLAVPMYNLVPSLLSPITLALMPMLGACLAAADRRGARQTLCTAWRVVALIAIPASLGLGVFAKPLLSLIYAGQDAAIAVAAPLLSLLALSIVPSAMLTLTGAVLQATGHTLLPVGAMTVGAVIKLLVELCLLQLPQVNIYGAPISTLCCTLTVLLIEWCVLVRILPFSVVAPRDLLRPLFCALGGVLPGVMLYFTCRMQWGEPVWLMPLVVALCAMLVFVLALRLRAVERGDLLTLPAGMQLCRLLEKCKLLK